MFVGCIYGDHEFGNAEEVVDYEDEEKRHPRNAPNVKDQDNENQRNKVITWAHLVCYTTLYYSLLSLFLVWESILAFTLVQPLHEWYSEFFDANEDKAVLYFSILG